MPLAVESGFPKSTYNSGSSTTWSVTVTTAGASVLVAAFCDHNSLGNASLPLTSVAGASLSWTKITGASANFNAGTDGVEFWYAVSSGAISAQSITATAPLAADLAYFAVWSITGADTGSPIGATAVTANTTTLLLTVNAQKANSFVLVLSGKYSSATALTADADNSPWDNHKEDGANTNAQGAGHATTSAAGNITVGATDTATSVSVSGAVEILQLISDTDSESITLSDSSSAYGPVNITVQTDFQPNAFQSDAFQIYGGEQATGAQTATDNEQILLSDSGSAAAAMPTTEAESILLSDSSAGANRSPVNDTESILLSDTANAQGRFAGTDAESILLSDSSATTGGFAAANSETITLSDSSATVQATPASDTETLLLSESYNGFVAYAATDNEAILLGDAYAASVSSPGGGPQTADNVEEIQLSDAAASSEAMASAYSDTIAFGDASDAAVALAPASYSDSVSEALVLADAYAATLSRAATYDANEALLLSDSSVAVLRTLPSSLVVGNHVNDGEFTQMQAAVQTLIDLHTTAPTVSGAKGGNTALASLLTALQHLGIVKDGST